MGKGKGQDKRFDKKTQRVGSRILGTYIQQHEGNKIKLAPISHLDAVGRNAMNNSKKSFKEEEIKHESTSSANLC